MNPAEKAAVEEWLKGQHRCAVCWWPKSDGRRQCELHHICGGFSRSKGHDKRNYLLLCERCHGVFHSGKIYALCPDLDRSTLLWSKEDSDPDNYDPQFLATLKNKRHLGYEPSPPDQYYLDERKWNSGPWKNRSPWRQ